MVSDYELDDRGSGFDPREKQRIFLLASASRPGSGAHPASCLMGTGGPFPGGKGRPGRDADHSPQIYRQNWRLGPAPITSAVALKVVKVETRRGG
jgi:hypothetical protein